MRFVRSGFRENFMMALDTLRQHKLRSFLTILGVVIGTMTVIVIAAFVSGIDARVSKEIESFGTNSIYAFKFDPGFNFNPSMEERTRQPLTEEDADAIRSECIDCEFVSPFMSPVDFTAGPFTERINVRHKTIEMTNATVQGASSDYFKMGVTNLAEGRYFTTDEEARRAKVAVVGVDVANTLFPFSTALDQEIQIEGRNYKIIGVLQAREIFLVGAEDPNNENKAVYLPFKTIKHLYPNNEDCFIMATAKPGKLTAALEEVRTIEIGIRKAIGARRSDIITQFLIEAATLTGLGGVIGIAIGISLALLIQMIMPTYVPVWSPIVGFVVSVGLGLIFGLLPAWKAARLNPIDALRYE